jgi:polar amino acid transport system substrate-binding protein
MLKWRKTAGMIGAFLIAASVVMAGCGGKETAKQDGAAKKAPAKEELIVGTEPSFAPFEFPDGKEGKIIGFDIDLINAIGKKMGYKTITVKSMGFDALIPAINSGNIDVAIAGMTITDARKKQVLFSDPYYESGLMTIVRKENDTIHSMADLKGKRIGVQLGTTGALEAEKIEGAKVTNFDTSDLACIELQNGNVDAVISDLPVLQYFLKQKGSSYAKAVGEPKKGEMYGIAAAKDKQDLIDGINKSLKELKDSGEYQKIYDKWFAEDKK